MLTFLLILSPIYLVVVATENCIKCDSCLSTRPSCYWCDNSPFTSRCVKFTSDTIAYIFCRSLWIHDKKMCPRQHRSVSDDLGDFSNDLFNERRLPIYSQVSSQDTQNTDLQELFHKLLLLKLLNKVKSGGDLSEKEKGLLYSLKGRIRSTSLPASTTVTPTVKKLFPTKRLDVDERLKELLNILKNEAKQELITGSAEDKIKNQIQQSQVKSTLKSSVDVGTAISATKVPARSSTNLRVLKPISESTHASKTKNVSINKESTTSQSTVTDGRANTHIVNRVEEGSVTYEEKAEENIDHFARKLPHKNYNATLKPQAKSKLKVIQISEDGNHCNLYEEKGLCNSAHNCTWCNTLDICMPRNDVNYEKCVRNAKNLVDIEYGLDRCLESKNCKQCVQDEKCYWCDTSRRCETYPFFGYVPDACGGNWYVTQCDVQLAVIIVVLPLVIILVAMVTFYFCLRYCHYRRKVLRVPLFEKPGIFDYRKGKKVFYVNPDDESDDELSKESIMKKYRLSVEKEPLIDPTT